MLSEVSQLQKDKYSMISPICRSLICGILKIQQTNECNRNRLTKNKLMVTTGRRKGGAHRSRGLRGTNFMRKISYKDILYRAGNIATIFNNLDVSPLKIVNHHSVHL